jgi:hypothetical protein
MKDTIIKFFGKYKKRPLDPEPKLETRQMNLKDFNINRLNNNTKDNVISELDIVDSISIERGDFYDEEE